jgi:hypothetical protein
MVVVKLFDKKKVKVPVQKKKKFNLRRKTASFTKCPDRLHMFMSSNTKEETTDEETKK